jgi:hypothetical protein
MKIKGTTTANSSRRDYWLKLMSLITKIKTTGMLNQALIIIGLNSPEEEIALLRKAISKMKTSCTLTQREDSLRNAASASALRVSSYLTKGLRNNADIVGCSEDLRHTMKCVRR